MVLSSAGNWHQLLVRTSPTQKVEEKDFRGEMQIHTVGPRGTFGYIEIWKNGHSLEIGQEMLNFEVGFGE